MVPNDWSLVEAKDVCKAISVGVVIKPTQYYVSKDEGIKAFRSANVREGFINDNDWVYFSKEGHAANKKSSLLAGDVLIVRTGYPGTACVVTPEFEGSNAIDIVIARPDSNKIIPEYLCAYTNSHIGKSQVLDLQGGLAQKHLNVGAYQVLKIKLPPLLEQNKITKILATWDKAISTTEQLLANSQQQKKALMQQLLTGKKRLLDKNGVRFSGEWKKVTLDSVADMNSGGTPKSSIEEYYGGDIPWVSIADMTKHGKWISSTERNISELGLANSSARLYPENTILYAMYASIGECSIAKVPLCSSQAILGIRPKKSLYFEFLYFFLVSLKDEIKLQGQQGTQANLNAGMVKGFSLRLPCIEEQQKIADVLSTTDQEIAALQQKLDALKQEKKALMQQLLTGKRRVKVEEAA
ncbi:restriction endonuclease subunit S [Aeromonas caviae]|uniref:restriction endonuclease subunit S n=4 Tax=Aeromonas caviae TaxID=648 RepID=UPI002B49B9AC|nr:restriction endonuclease subunit S [Aeromonas caviae]